MENRLDIVKSILEHPLEDEFYQGRSPDWEKVTVPFLSAADFAGFGLHPRGNYEAFMCAVSNTNGWNAILAGMKSGFTFNRA